MSKSNYAQKYALMCLRFSTECIKLAADAPTSELRAHFLRMASRWAKLADLARVQTLGRNRFGLNHDFALSICSVA